MSKYIDSLGLPGTKELDMGDSAAIYFNVEALSPGTFTTSPEVYFTTAPVRHPDTSKWWGQPDRYSRDQLIPMLCWAALQNKKDVDLIRKVRYSHFKRAFLLAWNTKRNWDMDVPDKFPDLTLFEIWGLWIRVHKPFWAKAVLWFLDLETLIASIHWKYFREDRVSRNHMLVAITQREVLPTFISKLSYSLNNWSDLVARWKAHCEACEEYQTADLFENKLLKEE